MVPEADVTEPLGIPWKRSAVNLPGPETIANYRNGQCHVHETPEDIRDHPDRYDPERNPVMHLVADAPLALMIFETLETLAVSTRDARGEDPVARIADLLYRDRVEPFVGVPGVARADRVAPARRGRDAGTVTAWPASPARR